MRQKLVSTTLLVALAILIELPVYAAAYPYKPGDQPVADALNYLRGVQASDGSIGDFASSAWAAMAIAAAGEDPHKWNKTNGSPSIIDYLKNNRGQLDHSKATDLARFILAMSAAGENPRDIEGTNYVALLKGLYSNGQLGDSSLLNDDFWGLMALVSAGEEDQAIIDNVRAFIKANQNPDGGWGYGVGLSSDVDDTAAAIMALTAAGEPRDSEAMMKAVSYLKGKLGEEGGFIYDSIPNSASDSLAIMALEALGVDVLGDEWTRKGVDPVSHLLSLQNGDGSFSWRAGRDGEALWTAYAILALLGKPLILGFIVPLPDISNSALMFLASILVLSNALALTKLKAGKRDILGR
ncbi:terpene cyclase/mutase family protein [Candidatus Bathyarchaeota archaeon]|nr:terpene cyclase/mutase family protein [Candidatus Bathyarchaeota archaeon]